MTWRQLVVGIVIAALLVGNAVVVAEGEEPDPAFSWTPGPVVLVHDAVRFTADAVPGADRYVWHFGNGNVSEGREVTHRFGEAGAATVTLVAYDVDDAVVARSTGTVPVQTHFTRDQVVKLEFFIPTSGTADLGVEYGGTRHASTSDVAPSGTPLANAPILLDATLYMPDPEVSEGPRPVAIATHGWAGSKTQYEGFGETFAKEGVGTYAQEGYHGLTYNYRGTGNSNGYQRAFDPAREMQDLKDILTWLADNDAHSGQVYDNRGVREDVAVDFEVLLDAPGDPVVGMLGQSGGGIHTLLLAGQDDRLDAAAPGGVYHDLYRSMAPGGVVKSTLTAGLVVSSGAQVGYRHLQGNPLFWATSPWTWSSVDTTIPLWAAYGYTGMDDELRRDFDARSPKTYNGNVSIPVWLSQGWVDEFFEPPEPLDNYVQLLTNPYFSSLDPDERRRQLKVTVQPTGHDFYRHKVQDQRVLFFNHHVKGHDLDAPYVGVVERYNGAWDHLPQATYRDVLDAPPILFHEDHPDDTWEPSGRHPGTDYAWTSESALERWIADGDDHWYDPFTDFHYRAYEAPVWTTPADARHYLRADGLTTEAPAGGLLTEPPNAIANVPGPGWTTRNPLGAQTGFPFHTVDHAPVATVQYRSAPLDADATLLGIPEAHLDVVVAAEAPLARGTASVHFVVKVWDEAPDGTLSLLTRGYKAVGVEDGDAVAREVTFPLYAMDRVVPEDHRIVVEVTHSDVTYVMPSLVPSVTLIRHDAENPSWVDLPVQ